MTTLYTYRQTFKTYQQAVEFIGTLINGGIVQEQNGEWLVWQMN